MKGNGQPIIVTTPPELVAVSETELRFIRALEKIEWKPNFTDISRETGLGISTIWETWERIKNKATIKVTIEFNR